MRTILSKAIKTLDHFPSIADLEKIAGELGLEANKTWKYFAVDDCMACGGPGWHYAFVPDGYEVVVACDDCAAGRNLQRAPKPHVNFTMKQVNGALYSRPANSRPHKQTESNDAA